MRNRSPRVRLRIAGTCYERLLNFAANSLILVVLSVAGGCGSAPEAEQSFPQKPIKVIVPFGAGGGSDTFTRILQKAIAKQDPLKQPLVVINMPGAGGSIGARKVKNARPDGYTILQMHDGILTNKYSGNANFGPESFIPIAGTGQMAHVIAVPNASPYRTLPDLLDAASKQPDEIVFAVGIGAPSHFAGLMLESASPDSAKFRFTQSGGGAKRFASLLGGHSQLTTFSVAEFVEFQASGLRALAILSGERHPKVPNVPTAIEQGVHVRSTNMHFWWAPKGTPPDRVHAIADALQDAMKAPDVVATLSELATEPVVLRGEELVSELSNRERQISAVSQRQTTEMPDFGLATLFACCLLGVTAFARSHRRPELPASTSTTTLDRRAQAMIVATMVLYVLGLQFSNLDYRFVTFLFVVVTGGFLTQRNKQLWIFVAGVALLLSLGLHFLFTRVLVVDLP